MSNELFAEGMRCHHGLYGFGTIISIDCKNNKTRIRFDIGNEDNFTTSSLIKSDRFVILPKEGDRNE